MHFRKALAISPHYPEANNNIGGILTNEGKFQEATDYFELSLKSMRSVTVSLSTGVTRSLTWDS